MVSKIRIGHPEISVCIWIVSIIPIVIILFLNPPWFITMLVIVSILIGMFAITWLPYYVSKYRLRPAIDKCRENETTWCRVTKDHIVVPQFVNKGAYGANHGVAYKDKADIVDDGSFPCRWLNGNPTNIMYDMCNTSIDLRKSVARKLMKKKYGIKNGVEAYKKAVEEKQIEW